MTNENGQLLLTEGDYQIRRYEGVPEVAITFLKEISWGSEGAVYVNNKTSEHIREMYNPILIAVQQGHRILSTAIFCNTRVCAGFNEFNCFYIKYFASSKDIRGKGVTKLMARKVMEAIRKPAGAKTIYFAGVEGGNKGSYKAVLAAGYAEIGTIQTLGFSRFFPRWDKRINRVTSEKDKQYILRLLQDYYSDHSLVQFRSIFRNNNYFVLRHNDEIVAGCQYHRGSWKVQKMKGASGKIVLKILPYIPLLNKIFNPRRFEFLAFEGIYCKPGCEKYMPKLFAGLLAQEQLNSAMFWLDEKCSVRKVLRSYGRPGLVHEFVKRSEVKIMASFQGLSEAEITFIKSNALYVSAFDYV